MRPLEVSFKARRKTFFKHIPTLLGKETFINQTKNKNKKSPLTISLVV